MVGTTLMLAGTMAMGNVLQVEASNWDDKISQTQNEIDNKLKEVNQVKEELDTLEKDIDKKEEDIKETEKEIIEKEEEYEERIEQLGGRLQAMQKSEINKNLIITVLNSESIADAVNTIYQVSLIKDASEKTIKDTQEEGERLDSLKEELVLVREELDNKKEDTIKTKEKLDEEVKGLKTTLAENKRKKEEEIKRQEEARKRALAKEEEKAKRATVASSGKEKDVTVKSKPAPAKTTAKSGWMTFESTAYSMHEPGLSHKTASGVDLRKNPRVVAVDPSVIPLGSKVEIEGMGVYLAADTGGAIKGRIIDVHFSDVSKLRPWGRRNVNIRIVE